VDREARGAAGPGEGSAGPGDAVIRTRVADGLAREAPLGAARVVAEAPRQMTALMTAHLLSLQQQWARRHGRRHDALACKKGGDTDT